MQVTNREIFEAREPLQALLAERWPIKTAYWLAKLARKIGEQHAIADDVRVRLIKQYGTQNGSGQISISPESPNWSQFAAEFNELMGLTIDIPIERIVLPETDARVTPSTLLALESFVEIAP